MNGKAGASSMNEDLSRYPSEFVLENSQVQRVCSHPQEPEWVTNIKKGVISSFQSTILPEGSSLGFNVTEVHSKLFVYIQHTYFHTQRGDHFISFANGKAFKPTFVLK